MAIQFTKPFSKIIKTDIALAGGKGAALGEMTQTAIPVPPGYVVLTTAFEHFLKEAHLEDPIQSILDKVDHHNMKVVERASEAIQSLILRAAMPAEIAQEIISAFVKLDSEFVAVRSSATAEDGADASWAGELDSYLNINRSNLLQKVQSCWASLFTARAIFYRFEKGFQKNHVSVAVVIQKMIESTVSGVAFSVHPVTEDPNHLIIEAGWGLGEALVSGAITPDNYIVDKRDFTLIESYVSEQARKIVAKKGGGNQWVEVPAIEREAQKLPSSKVLALANLVVHIEDYYGFPCDIEWALEGDELFVLQSRPITTLSG